MYDSIDWAMMVLRGVAGVVMLAHGIKHARGRAKTANWFGSIGFRMPDLQWFASTATEIGVGNSADRRAWDVVRCRRPCGRDGGRVLDGPPCGRVLGDGTAGRGMGVRPRTRQRRPRDRHRRSGCILHRCRDGHRGRARRLGRCCTRRWGSSGSRCADGGVLPSAGSRRSLKAPTTSIDSRRLLPIRPVDHVPQACLDFFGILIPVVVFTRKNIPQPVARDFVVTCQVRSTGTFVSPLLPTHAVISDFGLRILNPFVGHFQTLGSDPAEVNGTKRSRHLRRGRRGGQMRIGRRRGTVRGPPGRSTGLIGGVPHPRRFGCG